MELLWTVSNLTARDFFDIAFVTFLFFGISFLFRGTQASALLRGTLLTFGGLVLVSGVFQLQALQWLLRNSITLLAIALPIIFQPELRRALERLGRVGIFVPDSSPTQNNEKVVEEVCAAAEKLSERRHGALIVLERNTTLDEYVRTGVPLDSEVTSPLLLTIFWPKTELHDGAAIVSRDGRISAAGAVLPLSSSRNLPNKKQGTRHRAGLGITEVSDSVCVVVSEETGRISIANGGRMISRLDVKRLRTILTALYVPSSETKANVFRRLWRETLRLVQVIREREPVT